MAGFFLRSICFDQINFDPAISQNLIRTEKLRTPLYEHTGRRRAIFHTFFSLLEPSEGLPERGQQSTFFLHASPKFARVISVAIAVLWSALAAAQEIGAP